MIKSYLAEWRKNKHNYIFKKLHHGGVIIPRPPTIDYKLAIALWNNGYRDGEIAKVMSVKSSTIGCWRRRYGIPSNRKNQLHRFNEHTVNYDAVQQAYRAGKSDPQIAREAGCSPESVYKWRLKHDLPENYKRGNPGALLEGYVPDDTAKPWVDPESLFCDTSFLKELVGKDVRAGKECRGK